MRYIYPCTLAPDGEGGFIARFADVPEALTGARTETETIELASDALATALSGYVHEKRDIPAPSTLRKGQTAIPVIPVVAAKLALYTALRQQGITKVELASRLNITESAVRKLLNPDHRSHIGQVEAALKTVGRTLVIEDKAA